MSKRPRTGRVERYGSRRGADRRRRRRAALGAAAAEAVGDVGRRRVRRPAPRAPPEVVDRRRPTWSDMPRPVAPGPCPGLTRPARLLDAMVVSRRVPRQAQLDSPRGSDRNPEDRIGEDLPRGAGMSNRPPPHV